MSPSLEHAMLRHVLVMRMLQLKSAIYFGRALEAERLATLTADPWVRNEALTIAGDMLAGALSMEKTQRALSQLLKLAERELSGARVVAREVRVVFEDEASWWS